MTGLIIAIIAIGLTIYMVVAATSYLGESSENNGARAEFMKVLNESEQIAGALLAYRGHGNFITEDFTLDSLKEAKYLTDIPNNNWGFDSNRIFAPVNAHVCNEANKRMGAFFDVDDTDIYIDSEYPQAPIPYCSKEGVADRTLCCFAVEAEASVVTP